LLTPVTFLIQAYVLEFKIGAIKIIQRCPTKLTGSILNMVFFTMARRVKGRKPEIVVD
jgi:hypothetical protein